MFYMARDGENFMKMQLHRVGSRRQERRAADRSEVQPHRRDLRRWRRRRAWRRWGRGAGRSGRVRHLARQQVLRRRLPDARRGAGDADGRRDVGKVLAQVAKSDLTKFNQLGLKKVEILHLQGGGRPDGCCGDRSASRPTSIRRRSIRCWRPVYGGPGSGVLQRDVPGDLQPHAEYGFPGRPGELALGAGPRQADARSGLPEARASSRWTTWPRASGRSGRGRTSTRRASGFTAPRTAGTARRCRS